MDVNELQEQIRKMRKAHKPLSLRYCKGHSNTTRSKSYKEGCNTLDCGPLNQILLLDTKRKRISVQPRITIEELVRATLPYGLMPSITPEFKGITVGGAIMGGAAESTSHQLGIFHDSCTAIELLDGEGNLVSASPSKNADLFYGISGSYGSLGMLVSAEIELIPAQPTVQLCYHFFTNPQKALEALAELAGTCDFLDGIIYHKNHAVIIEGHLKNPQEIIFDALPKYREIQGIPSSKWYAQHVKELTQNQEEMHLFDYLFRYDQGAFWMGSYLFSSSFLSRYIGQGLLKIWPSQEWFSAKEIELFRNPSFPRTFLRKLVSPFMQSQRLWGLLHKAEKWVQNRLVIQDFCIPQPKASDFLSTILEDPGLFPIWLCPLKGTQTPQLFAPHYGHPCFINFGLYGIPSYAAPMGHIIQRLESKTQEYGGRKVLYSRSYYSEEDFWKIYSREGYEALRKKTHAKGVWRELTEKVLSE